MELSVSAILHRSPRARGSWASESRITRQLQGKLRELRFYVGRERYRITYYIAKGRRIILLTIFKKTAQREGTEIARAEVAMARCVEEGHTAEEADDAD
jgi:phage-related protein